MIVTGSMIYSQDVECGGILSIGDVHISARKPGRRLDTDWPNAILAKLEACVAIANERDLLPVFLGDIFDEAVEEDEALKTRLIRVLKGFKYQPITNTGNHDIRNTSLSDGDTLATLGVSDVLDVVATSGVVCVVATGGRRIALGFTPYGEDIPRDVTGQIEGADSVIWFTHHDIAFAGTYPGSAPPHEIAGCRLVINGHIHLDKPSIKAGITTWMNPGSIVRQSIDLIDHRPSALILQAGSVETFPLPHAQGVFDLTGRFVDAADGEMVRAEAVSAFVTLLQAESTTDLARSADGSLMEEEILAKFERDKTPEHVRVQVLSLLREAVTRKAA